MYAALMCRRGNRTNEFIRWRDLERKPTPKNFDAAMLEAIGRELFRSSYWIRRLLPNVKPPTLIGSYSDGLLPDKPLPGGSLRMANGAQNGIVGWGVTTYSAINEPDVLASIPRGDYHDALAGLSDGVHSVKTELRVVPGGFATCNSAADATLRGYGPAIADLLEDGHLDGIDLHTYYHSRWFPLTRDRYFSAQGCFDRVKAALGLRAM